MPCVSHTLTQRRKKRLHPADKVCKINDMNMPKLILTKEMRRAVCVHEAGHAVIHALGGSIVHRVAVAPEGDDGTWAIEGRKGGTLTDLWGVCQASDFFEMDRAMTWNEDEMTWECDRKRFDAQLRQVESHLAEHGRRHARRYIPESRRIVRAYICAGIAGPAAEQIFNGEEVWLDEADDYSNATEDIVIAQARSWLLPYRNEYSHAVEVTEAALRRPDIWERVIRLADELERLGDMDDELDGFLPDALPGWPSSPGSRAHRKTT
jgi:hypothetical protein